MNNDQRPALLLGSRTLYKDASPRKEQSSLMIRGEAQETVLQRNITQLFTRQSNKIYRELKSAIEDIDAPPQSKGLGTQLQDYHTVETKYLTQCADRFTKIMLSRNVETRRTINDYQRQHQDRFSEQQMPTAQSLTIEQPQATARIPLLRSKTRIRPASSKTIKVFSVSSSSEKNVRNKERPNYSPAAPTRAVEFECQSLPRFFGTAEDAQKQPAKPEQTFRNADVLLGLDSSRTSIRELAKQYLPTFTFRNRTSSSNSCQRKNEADILRDRLKLFNTGVPVQMVRQQGYRRKCRDPRPFTNFFI